jgi:uncharacterized protein YndB with AHSA1/START domain
VVARLAGDDAPVNDLAEPYDVTVQAVSTHLNVLEKAGLVSRRRQGRHRPVHLEAKVLDLMTAWIERYRRQAEERYRRLDDLLPSVPDHVPESVALERLRFDDLGDGRTSLTATSLVDSFQERDAWLASGMQDGIPESYEPLDELLGG